MTLTRPSAGLPPGTRATRSDDELALHVGSFWRIGADLAIPTFHTNGTHTIASEETVTAIAARGAVLAGRPAVLLELHLARTQSCRVCVPEVARSPTRSTGVLVCRLGPIGIACTEAIWVDGSAAPIHARGGHLEIDRDAAGDGIVRGAYALSPP